MTRFSLRTRTWPWFSLAALLFVLALVFIRGSAQGMVDAAAMFIFLGACIRAISLAVRDNPVTTKMLARRDLVHSALLSESTRDRRGR